MDTHTHDLRIKHLEMIQVVVARMSSYGASIKNYCITVISALAGAAITLQQSSVVLIAVFAAISFAAIDARYLVLEKAYRTLYDKVRCGKWSDSPDFDLQATSVGDHSFLKAFFSWSVCWFYGPVTAVMVALFCFLGAKYGWPV